MPPGRKLFHSVEEPGNAIHSGVWTGRYLAGVGYQYAVTKDARVRAHGGEILQALRRQQEVTGKPGLMGARVRTIAASASRTFVLRAHKDKGAFVTLDGGMSWRPAVEEPPDSGSPDYRRWQGAPGGPVSRISEEGELLRSNDGGRSGAPWMKGWRVSRAESFFLTPRGILSSGPGGAYLSKDGTTWTELKLCREEETGSADFLHIY